MAAGSIYTRSWYLHLHCWYIYHQSDVKIWTDRRTDIAWQLEADRQLNIGGQTGRDRQTDITLYMWYKHHRINNVNKFLERKKKKKHCYHIFFLFLFFFQASIKVFIFNQYRFLPCRNKKKKKCWKYFRKWFILRLNSNHQFLQHRQQRCKLSWCVGKSIRENCEDCIGRLN